MGGMEEEFENVGMVHREVTSGSRLFEPAIWMQCMTWVLAAKKAGEVTVARVRSVNDLVIDTLLAEQRRRLLKRQGKGKRGRLQRDEVRVTSL
ncbi:hypothetical protein V6N13_125990 [Hibiscus sabdariffa]